jgi:hypothetical protein
MHGRWIHGREGRDSGGGLHDVLALRDARLRTLRFTVPALWSTLAARRRFTSGPNPNSEVNESGRSAEVLLLRFERSSCATEMID